MHDAVVGGDTSSFQQVRRKTYLPMRRGPVTPDTRGFTQHSHANEAPGPAEDDVLTEDFYALQRDIERLGLTQIQYLHNVKTLILLYVRPIASKEDAHEPPISLPQKYLFQ
jgi:hypothetical protein